MRSLSGSRKLPVFAAILLLVVGAVATAGLASSDQLRVVRGSTQADVIDGTSKGERIYGFAGDDKLFGLAGNDLIVAGTGKDRVWAGNGNDRVNIRDGKRDTLFCGPGLDVIAADKLDVVGRDCERRNLNLKTLPAAPLPLLNSVDHHHGNPPSPPPGPPAPPPPPPSSRTYELSVTVTGTGTVTSSPAGIGCPSRCKGTFAKDASVTLTAKPGAGQRIQGWGGRCRGTRSTCHVRMGGTASVRVSFAAGTGTTNPPPPPSSPPPPPTPPPPPPSGGTTGSVVLNGSKWTCSGPVNLDLVRVTNPPGDAISLSNGCTGRIGRIEVETWTADGVKIQNNQSSPAHDLTIGGGYVRCHAIDGDVHQDAVQAMAGERITFTGVFFDCLGNSNFFVNRAAGSSIPTDIVCDGCTFGGKSSTTVRVNVSVRSGVRNSAGCSGRNVKAPFYFTELALNPVNSGNRELPSNDSTCA